MKNSALQSLVPVVAFGGLLVLSTSVVCIYFLTPFFSRVSPPLSPHQSIDTLVFYGDIMLGRGVEMLMDAHGDGYPFLRMSPKKSREMWVGNFESAMAIPHVPTKPFTFSFSVKEAYAQTLIAKGFTVLSLANNHSSDFGKKGYENAKHILETSGAIVFGEGSSVGSSSIAIVPFGSQTVGLIGIHTVYGTPNREEVLRALKQAKEKSDIQIAYIHWGLEYELVHEKTQESYAQFLIDNGVDAVVGHHPHVVQDIGLYKGKPIFYSLGNFIFDQYFSEDVMNGLVLSLRKEADVYIWSLTPVTSRDVKAQPREMTPHERTLFLKELALRSEKTLAAEIEKGEIRIIANE